MFIRPKLNTPPTLKLRRILTILIPAASRGVLTAEENKFQKPSFVKIPPMPRL
jgi:hypothetical protein